MHSFLSLSLYSCVVPVEFRFPVTCSHLPSGVASEGRNQSATFGVFGPESNQSATSTFKFVECTTNHATRSNACKHCRSAKVLPELTEASKQTSNYLLGSANALKCSDARRAVSSLQLLCAFLMRGSQCRTVRGEAPCVQRRAWRKTDTKRCI